MTTETPARGAPYDCDVAIVGFGPTGSALAGYLGAAGHRVLAIEREHDVYSLPRAVHYDHEVMRHLQSLGVADAILPTTRAIDACEFWTASGEVMVHLPTGFEQTDQGWASDYIFHQPTLERVLRDNAEAYPTVAVRLGDSVTGVEADDHGVTLTIETESGQQDQVRARFVVGCDGARSTVRAAAGLELEDLGFDEPWVVVDLEGVSGMTELVVQVCDPKRPTTLVPGASGRFRFEFMLLPHEIDTEMDRPEVLRGLVSRWLDPDAVKIIRAAVYRFHGLVAKGWRAGRLFIAGDAAHQTPPFMGQGMCAGIRDAANLSWKLDLVLRGLVPQGVLDTYATERTPHVRRFIQQAIVMGRVVCVQDEEQARLRDEQMLAARASQDELPPANRVPRLGPGCFQAAGPDDTIALIQNLAPQPRVRAEGFEGLLDDLTGSGFRLVLRDERGLPEDGERLARFRAIGGSCLVWSDAHTAQAGCRVALDAAGSAGAYFDTHGVHAFLVRPDHVVFGVALTPEDVDPLLDELDGALGR